MLFGGVWLHLVMLGDVCWCMEMLVVFEDVWLVV